MRPTALLLLVTLPALAGCNSDKLAPRPVPPTAVITGGDQWAPHDSAAFDGSSSFSQGSPIVKYDWWWQWRPPGSTAPLTLLSGNPAKVGFQIDVAGEYVLGLTVTDGRGMTGSSVHPFHAHPWGAIRVELDWDTADTDVDLHLLEETQGGLLFTAPWDCYFENTDPDWGALNVTTDNPTIDRDATSGFGPELIQLTRPVEGHHYRVWAHYYNDRGHGSTRATVRVWLSGQLRYEGIKSLPMTDAAWNVASISWPDGAITPDGTLTSITPP